MSKVVVSINQPAYLPWLGYFHRIAVSDIHIVLDHVQFEKNSFINRNRLRTYDGWCWLSVPVMTKGRFNDLAIEHLNISNETGWARKHRDCMRLNYGKTRFIKEHWQFFDEIYNRQWDRLLPLINITTEYLLRELNINTPIMHSSGMTAKGAKDELILDLCLKTGATHYLSGQLGKNYLREDLFNAAGIEVLYQDYIHPTYTQLWDGFEPFMSGVDLLLNHGSEQGRRILMSGNSERVEYEH